MLLLLWVRVRVNVDVASCVPPEPARPPCIRRPAGGAGEPRERDAVNSGGLVQRGKGHRGLS